MTFPTPIKSIRLKCLDCCCGSPKEVELCPVVGCTLYPYRFGKRPTTSRKRSFVKSDEVAHTFFEDGNEDE